MVRIVSYRHYAPPARDARLLILLDFNLHKLQLTLHVLPSCQAAKHSNLFLDNFQVLLSYVLYQAKAV